jgi:hypothetical protein
MKAKELKAGDVFTCVGYTDPESPVRVCLQADNKEVKFGFHNKPDFWYYMGGEVDVELVEAATPDAEDKDTGLFCGAVGTITEDQQQAFDAVFTDHESNNYRVTLKEDPEDKFTLVFDCFADDDDHAEEQAEDMYPGCVIVNITKLY